MKRTTKEFMEYYHEARRNLTGTYEEKQAAEKAMWAEWFNEMEVGDHVHVKAWTDIEPATIIHRTATTITVRYDKAERDPEWKPEYIIGGFSAHCTNDEDQRWIISEDPEGRTQTFRWSKRSNIFMDGQTGLKLYPGWKKYYDYNF